MKFEETCSREDECTGSPQNRSVSRELFAQGPASSQGLVRAIQDSYPGHGGHPATGPARSRLPASQHPRSRGLAGRNDPQQVPVVLARAPPQALRSSRRRGPGVRGRAHEGADLRRDLDILLERLPERCRSLLALRYRQGYEPPELAERLGYSPSSISKITTRCLAALTRHLVTAGICTKKAEND
jgi:RNA polymerase sigma factor (sigma-70 family)